MTTTVDYYPGTDVTEVRILGSSLDGSVTNQAQENLILIVIDDPPPLPHFQESIWRYNPAGIGDITDPDDPAIASQNLYPFVPNLDKFASEGVILTSAVNTAVCTPGRAGLMFGAYGHWHGCGTIVRANRSDPSDLFELGESNLTVYPPQEGHAGFRPTDWGGQSLGVRLDSPQTGPVHKVIVGKLHFSGDNHPQGSDPVGMEWDIIGNPGETPENPGGETGILGRWDYRYTMINNHNNFPVPGTGGVGEGTVPGSGSHYFYRVKKEQTELNVGSIASPGSGLATDGNSDGRWSTSQFIDKTIEAFQQAPAGKQVFAYVPLTLSHSPFDSAPYNLITTAEYKNMGDGTTTGDDGINESSEANEDSSRVTIWKRQLGMMEALDHEIGRLMIELEAMGQLATTNIMVIADNGADPLFVDHGLDEDSKDLGTEYDTLRNKPEGRFKASVYNYGISSQVYWWGPRVQSAGRAIDAPVDISVDAYATICELFNVDPGVTNGTSFLKLISNTQAESNHPREFNYSYHHYPNGSYKAIPPPAAQWDSSTAYVSGDQVTNNGLLYEALASNTNEEPTGTGTSGSWDNIARRDQMARKSFSSGEFVMIKYLGDGGAARRLYQRKNAAGAFIDPQELTELDLLSYQVEAGGLEAILNGIIGEQEPGGLPGGGGGPDPGDLFGQPIPDDDPDPPDDAWLPVGDGNPPQLLQVHFRITNEVGTDFTFTVDPPAASSWIFEPTLAQMRYAVTRSTVTVESGKQLNVFVGWSDYPNHPNPLFRDGAVVSWRIANAIINTDTYHLQKVIATQGSVQKQWGDGNTGLDGDVILMQGAAFGRFAVGTDVAKQALETWQQILTNEPPPNFADAQAAAEEQQILSFKDGQYGSYNPRGQGHSMDPGPEEGSGKGIYFNFGYKSPQGYRYAWANCESAMARMRLIKLDANNDLWTPVGPNFEYSLERAGNTNVPSGYESTIDTGWCKYIQAGYGPGPMITAASSDEWGPFAGSHLIRGYWAMVECAPYDPMCIEWIRDIAHDVRLARGTEQITPPSTNPSLLNSWHLREYADSDTGTFPGVTAGNFGPYFTRRNFTHYYGAIFHAMKWWPSEFQTIHDYMVETVEDHICPVWPLPWVNSPPVDAGANANTHGLDYWKQWRSEGPPTWGGDPDDAYPAPSTGTVGIVSKMFEAMYFAITLKRMGLTTRFEEAKEYIRSGWSAGNEPPAGLLPRVWSVDDGDGHWIDTRQNDGQNLVFHTMEEKFNSALPAGEKWGRHDNATAALTLWEAGDSGAATCGSDQDHGAYLAYHMYDHLIGNGF